MLELFATVLTLLIFEQFPDRPNPLAKWYLPEASFVAARRRVARIGRQNPEPLTLKVRT